MTEEKKLYKVLIFLFILGVLGVVISSNNLLLKFKPLFLDFNATINIENRLTLEEHYKFFVNEDKKYRMLYRYWEEPLVLKDVDGAVYVKFLSGEGDGNFYLMTSGGIVPKELLNLSQKELMLVKETALKNEVGILNINRFNKGIYNLYAKYELNFPIRQDENHKHINIKLASNDNHIFYRNVNVKINDPLNKIVKIYPHIPKAKIIKENNFYIVKGLAPESSLVEIEMVLKNDFDLKGVIIKDNNVLQKTFTANRLYQTLELLYNHIIPIILKFILLFIPVYILFIYRKFGKEKQFTVPKFLSYVPNKERHPAIVNLVFSGDASIADENAFFSTLLVLQDKGVIKIDEQGKVYLLKEPDGDLNSYELKVLNYLKKYAVNEVFDPKKLEEYVKILEHQRNTTKLKEILTDISFVLTDFLITSDIPSKYLDTKGHKILFVSWILTLIFISIGIALGIFVLDKSVLAGNIWGYELIVLFAAGWIQFLVAIFSLESQILGRWKDNYYEEKLKWQSFKRFLSDFAMIKKYQPEDIVIWKEWLIYATALGVADKVEESLKKLNIKIPQIEDYNNVRQFRHSFYRLHQSSDRAYNNLTSSSSSSGGYGAGGGSGGGGAGGR